MRCDCCNKRLTVDECLQKHTVTDEYLNTCNKCLDGLGIPIKGQVDTTPDFKVDSLFSTDYLLEQDDEF